MRNLIIRSIRCIFFLMIAFSIESANAQQERWYTEGDFTPVIRIRVVLTNPLGVERKECPVVISRDLMPFTSFYEESIFVVDPLLPSQPDPSYEQAKAVGSGITFKETNGHHIPYQLDDIDKDGVWDELFFMTDFKPHEKKMIYLYIGKNERGMFEHHTHAEIGSYGKHIIPWWESEVMGWKLWYFSDVDLYGKREPMLVSNHENTVNTSGYTAGSKYGNDIMTVESLFGVGGICLFEDEAHPDKISRPRFSSFKGKGQIFDTRYAFDVVVNGPLRSMIRVHIMNWRTGRGAYELEQLYTAYKNKSYSTCKVKFLSFTSETNNISFGCGIRKLMKEAEFYHDNGALISLAQNVDIFDPDVQRQFETRLIVDFIGIALVVKNSDDSQYQFIKDFDGNHTFRIPVTPDRSFEYLIAAGWSEGSVNRTADEFKKYVLSTTLEYRHPIEITSLLLEKNNRLNTR